MSRPEPSDLPNELALSLGDVLVIPLNIPALIQPTRQIAVINFIHADKTNRGIFEFSGPWFQIRFTEICTTPEHQANAALQFAVSHRRVVIEKPDRVSVPDLALRLGQALIYRLPQRVTDRLVFFRLRVVEFVN